MIKLSDLPPVRGRYHEHAPLKNMTWFAVGGPAELLFKPKDISDLGVFLKKASTLPLTILGAGSNVIVRDGGISGITLKLGRGFSTLDVYDRHIEVGAGCLDRTLALTCQAHGLSGLEFLIGIPGSVGGALAMNAGAHGVETADRLLWAEAYAPDGSYHRLLPQDIGFDYRTCRIPNGWIFTKAALRVSPSTPERVEKRLRDILQDRQNAQPTHGKTGGSTFKNPQSRSAWKLIDEAGCRGMTEGGAMISEKHCNFMLNLGHACAQDLETLGENVRKKVLHTSGIDLIWEIKRLGQYVNTAQSA